MTWKSAPTTAAVLSGIAILLGSCGGNDDGETTPTPGEPSANVTVSMVDNDFVPPEFVVPVGVPVTITAKNDGAAVHNLLVTVGDSQFGSEPLVAPGASSNFEVTFPEAGEYDFVCGLHLPDMAGTITAR